MKNLITRLIIVLPLLVFVACSDSDDNYSLQKTTWGRLVKEDGYIRIQKLYFEENLVNYYSSYVHDGQDGSYDFLVENEEKRTKHEVAPYTYARPIVTMSFSDLGTTGAISGNELTFENASGEVLVFIRE